MRTATITGEPSAPGNSLAIASWTARAELLDGSTFQSTCVIRSPSTGLASASRSAVLASAIGSGLRITRREVRYQPLPVDGRALSCAARRQRCGESELTRQRSSASTAGRNTSALVPAISATRMPPIPIERRNGCGNTSRLLSTAATVAQLTATVLPALAIVRRSAASHGPAGAISSRYRETISRL